ncbi:hypothetical protein CEXT_4891 [Caerostris extrusa]|uniref:Ycf15 n=1 Tax=Caerostris extrusa TaxID=172846 RepID=A0AAV4TGI7_CAEEX|nr:hypothetical protein CEXT_4891 [Caerostris extrusa]
MCFSVKIFPSHQLQAKQITAQIGDLADKETNMLSRTWDKNLFPYPFFPDRLARRQRTGPSAEMSTGIPENLFQSNLKTEHFLRKALRRRSCYNVIDMLSFLSGII